jgi:hypothetical protein
MKHKTLSDNQIHLLGFFNDSPKIHAVILKERFRVHKNTIKSLESLKLIECITGSEETYYQTTDTGKKAVSQIFKPKQDE